MEASAPLAQLVAAAVWQRHCAACTPHWQHRDCPSAAASTSHQHAVACAGHGLGSPAGQHGGGSATAVTGARFALMGACSELWKARQRPHNQASGLGRVAVPRACRTMSHVPRNLAAQHHIRSCWRQPVVLPACCEGRSRAACPGTYSVAARCCPPASPDWRGAASGVLHVFSIRKTACALCAVDRCGVLAQTSWRRRRCACEKQGYGRLRRVACCCAHALLVRMR
jgi:hypothetical protein